MGSQKQFVMPRMGGKKQHPGFMNLLEKNFDFSTESFSL